jgi:peptidoglycan/xylan/chitin deacetylase (PgdA/CDA1 family)
MPHRKALIRAGLETLYRTRLHRVLEPFCAGSGVILTLHRVRPSRDLSFEPNRLLEVAPDFLDAAIGALKAQGFVFDTLDSMVERLRYGRCDGTRRIALTFDDAYRDVIEYGYPVMKAYDVPFTLFVASDFASGRGLLWWQVLEEVVAASEHIEASIGGRAYACAAATPAEKARAFDMLYWPLRALAPTARIVETVAGLAARAGLDLEGHVARECLNWDELRALKGEPLVSFGAHTMSHALLAREDDERVLAEISGSMDRIEAELGVRPRHLAYPVGDTSAASLREFAAARAVGLSSAVTTNPGVITQSAAADLWSLPRISLNGEFQDLRYLDVLVSGAPFAFLRRPMREKAA